MTPAVPSAGFLKTLSALLPERVLRLRSLQIIGARLLVADRMRRKSVAPDMPIVGELVLDRAAQWRAQFAAMLWSVARAAQSANGRLAWALCIGFPPEAPEDLYAMAVQADPLVQLHIFADGSEAKEFCDRYVPPASLREANARGRRDVKAVLALAGTVPSAFTRPTSVRASAHVFVKQIGGDCPVVAVHVGELSTLIAARNAAREMAGVRLLVVGEPPAKAEAAAHDASIMFARRLGFSLLGELALIAVCDGYVGRPDHYAIVAADAGVPCLLAGAPAGKIDGSSRVRLAGDITSELPCWLSQEVIEPRALASNRGRKC